MRRAKTWVSGPPSESPGREALIDLYINRKQSLADIAARYDVSKTCASRWLKREEIATRSISEATSIAQAGKPLTGKTRELAVQKVAKAREHITTESREKQRQKMLGRTPSNKGTKWSDELREKHMEVRRSDVYRQKLSEAHSGEKSYLWRGGSDRQRRDWKWRQRAKECYARDGWICQECGVHCTSRGTYRIQAHHIVPRRQGGSDELENLITLCAPCHTSITRKEI